MDRPTPVWNTPSCSKPSEAYVDPKEEYARSKNEALRQLCMEETSILQMLEKVKVAKNKLLLERLALVNELNVQNGRSQTELKLPVRPDPLISESNTKSLSLPKQETVHKTVHSYRPKVSTGCTSMAKKLADMPSSKKPTSSGFLYKQSPDHTVNKSTEQVVRNVPSVLELMVDGDYFQPDIKGSHNTPSCSDSDDNWLDEMDLL